MMRGFSFLLLSTLVGGFMAVSNFCSAQSPKADAAKAPATNSQSSNTPAKPFVPNYDESKIPNYTLPPILDPTPGSVDEAKRAWEKRRIELLKLFEVEMFGSYPQSPYELDCQLVESGDAFGGKALRQQFRSDGQDQSSVAAHRPADLLAKECIATGSLFSGIELSRQSYCQR